MDVRVAQHLLRVAFGSDFYPRSIARTCLSVDSGRQCNWGLKAPTRHTRPCGNSTEKAERRGSSSTNSPDLMRPARQCQEMSPPSRDAAPGRGSSVSPLSGCVAQLFSGWSPPPSGPMPIALVLRSDRYIGSVGESNRRISAQSRHPPGFRVRLGLACSQAQPSSALQGASAPPLDNGGRTGDRSEQARAPAQARSTGAPSDKVGPDGRLGRG